MGGIANVFAARAWLLWGKQKERSTGLLFFILVVWAGGWKVSVGSILKTSSPWQPRLCHRCVSRPSVAPWTGGIQSFADWANQQPLASWKALGLVTDLFWDTWDRGTLSLRNIIMDLEHQKSLRESSARNQRVNTTVWNLNWSPSGRVKQVYMGPGMGGMKGVRLKDASYACSSQLGRMAWPLGPLVSWPRANKYDNTSVLLAVRKNGLHLVPLWEMKRKSMYRRLPWVPLIISYR